ncbi:MAG: hypothetical protein U1D55_08520 [Phycisphaerae bacterium]
MDADTELGGPGRRFPETEHSAVRAARSDDPALRQRAVEAIAHAYWKPLYKYLRFRWHLSNDEAKDATQSFFADALARRLFERFDPQRAAFRTYLRTCIDAHVANRARDAARLKRGGGERLLSLDFEAAESELSRHPPPPDADLEARFEHEWIRNVFSLAVERLRAVCTAQNKLVHFTLFSRYDLRGDEQPATTYDDLAREFALPITQVTNFLAWARRTFRAAVLDVLRECTAGDDEFREAAQRVLGVRP